VFRTYNASVTLDALLHKESTTTTVDEKKAEYDRANKEVRQQKVSQIGVHCV
jgi:DNA topoisomerase-1